MPIKVHVPPGEEYNRLTNMFTYTKEQTLILEHSLISISNWESKWHVPYLSNKPKSNEMIIDYIRCMTITPKEVDPNVYYVIPGSELSRIQEYINNPMTASTFSNRNRRHQMRIITAETIYAWMIQYSIPFECEKWHFNRLMALIQACGALNTPPQKMSKAAIARQNDEINRARRAALHSKG